MGICAETENIDSASLLPCRYLRDPSLTEDVRCWHFIEFA